MSTWAIDWKEMMEGYNRIYKTKYKKLEEFLITESDKLTVDVFADRLGVSRGTVYRIKRDLRITRPYLGVKNPKDKVRDLIRSGQVKNMSVKEIAKYAGYKYLNSVYPVLQEVG